MNRFFKALKRQVDKIREINKTYAKPRLEMSAGTKFALLFLRFYLIFLVALLIYKFVTIVTH